MITLTTASGHTIEVTPPSSPAVIGRMLARIVQVKRSQPCPKHPNPTPAADVAHRRPTSPSPATPPAFLPGRGSR